MFDHNFIFAITWIRPIPRNKSNSFFIWSPTSNKRDLNTIPCLLHWYSNQLATGYFTKLGNLSELRWLFVLPAIASERADTVLLLGWAQTYWFESFALFKTLSWPDLQPVRWEVTPASAHFRKHLEEPLWKHHCSERYLVHLWEEKKKNKQNMGQSHEYATIKLKKKNKNEGMEAAEHPEFYWISSA